MNSNLNETDCLHFSIQLALDDNSVADYLIPVKPGRRRKSIALKFQQQQPFIDVPKHLSRAETLNLLNQHRSWFQKALLKWHNRQVLTAETQSATDSESGSNSTTDSLLNSNGKNNGLPFGADGYRLTTNNSSTLSLRPVLWQGDWLPVKVAGRLQNFDSAICKDFQQGLQLNRKDWRAFRNALSGSGYFHALIKGLQDDPASLLQKCQNWAERQFWAKQWMIVMAESAGELQKVFSPAQWFSGYAELSQPGFWVGCLPYASKSFVDEFEPQNLTLAQRIQVEELMNWCVNWVLAVLLGRAYQQALQQYLGQVLPKWANRMGLSYRNFAVKNYKSRWGSCKSDGSLQFNWRLCQAPLTVIDSLLIHELAHLQHPNHSRQFWDLVRQFDTHLSASENQLKTQGRSWIKFLNIAYR